MEVKRILFPLAFLLIPTAILGGLYLKSERDLTAKYVESLAAARALGIPTSLAELKRNMPPDNENAVPAILSAARATDFEILARSTGSAHIKESARLLLEVESALARPKFAVAPGGVEAMERDQRLLTQTVKALIDRATWQMGARDIGAVRSLKVAKNLNDRILASNRIFAALNADAQVDELNARALSIASRFGKLGVDGVRSLVQTEDPEFDLYAVVRETVPLTLIHIEEDHARRRYPRRRFIDRKTEILEEGIGMLSRPNLRGTREEFATQHLGSLNGTLVVARPRMEVPDDLLEYYFAACTAGGKPSQPAGKDKYGQQIRYIKIPGGFSIRSWGKNGIDEGGGGDDRWITHAGGSTNWKNE